MCYILSFVRCRYRSIGQSQCQREKILVFPFIFLFSIKNFCLGSLTSGIRSSNTWYSQIGPMLFRDCRKRQNKIL